MQGLYDRDGWWWVRFSFAGRQHRVALHTDDQAEAIVAARRVLVDPAAALGLAARGSWKDAVDAFLATKAGASRRTRDTYKIQLGTAQRSIGREMLHAVTQKDVQAYYQQRTKEVSPASAREAWDYLRWFLRWCVAEGMLRKNPCDGVTVPVVRTVARKRFLSRDEILLVMETPCDPLLRFALFCALHAGLRKEEIIQARPEWFDLHAGLLHLRGYPAFTHGGMQHRGWVPKDREDRTIPLTDGFREFLTTYDMQGQDFCIAPGVGQGKHRYRYDFRRQYARHLTDCGLTDVTFHDLRRTFASQLVSAGVSIYKVARWMGDGIVVAEKHYGHLIPNDDEINKSWL